MRKLLKFSFYVLVLCVPVLLAENSKKESSVEKETASELKPKWADYDAWRKRLKRGIPETGVKSILGEPLYIKQTSEQAFWYYQHRPVLVKIAERENTQEIIKYPELGIVTFSRKILPSNRRSSAGTKPKGSKPIYLLSSWTEPDWQTVEAGDYELPEPPKKLKPLRRLQPYEIKRTWSKLRFGLDEQAVRRIMGEPTRATQSPGAIYEYDLPGGDVLLKFGLYGLEEWEEPFWIAVEAALYKEVEEEPKGKVKKDKEEATVASSPDKPMD